MMFKIIEAVLISTILAVPVHDHLHLSDWIREQGLQDKFTKEWCCGENDCAMLPPDAVKETTNGYFYITITNELFPEARVLWKSPDGAWWRCKKPDTSTRCLIGPPRST